jgi:uncharacterized protein
MASIEVTAVVSAEEPTDFNACFDLGMKFSVDADMVTAHKWFNIAAMRGHKDAIRLRREIAEQMSDSEIGCAQRAARDWLKMHPQPIDSIVEVRAAA